MKQIHFQFTRVAHRLQALVVVMLTMFTSAWADEITFRHAQITKENDMTITATDTVTGISVKLYHGVPNTKWIYSGSVWNLNADDELEWYNGENPYLQVTSPSKYVINSAMVSGKTIPGSAPQWSFDYSFTFYGDSEISFWNSTGGNYVNVLPVSSIKIKYEKLVSSVSLSTPSIEMNALDTTEVKVNLKKVDPLSSLQMNITLPDGISYIDGSAALGSMATDATLHIEKYEGTNKYNVQILTNSQAEFEGDKGQILSFKVKGNKALTGKIGLTNIIGSTNEATPQQVEMVDTTCAVTVSKRPSDFAFAKGTEEHPDTIIGSGRGRRIRFVNSSSKLIEQVNINADKPVDIDKFLVSFVEIEENKVSIFAINKANVKEPVLFTISYKSPTDDVYEEGRDTLYIQWIPIIYDNLNDTITLAEDYSSIIERTEYASIKAGLDEAISTAKTFLTATSQAKVDGAAHSLKNALDDAIKAVEEYNYDNGIFTGVNVSISGNTSSLFFQTADKPSVSIRRDGNSRIAEVRLSNGDEVRKSTELADDNYMVLSFDERSLGSREFNFYDQTRVDGITKTTTRNEVDAVHGDDFVINYERQFNSTDYEAIALPFNLPADKATDAGMNIYRIRTAQNYYDQPSSDGFVDQGTEAVQFFIEKLKSTEVAKAGMPYLVRANQAGKVEITLDNATLNLPESKTLHTNTTLVNYDFISSVNTIMAKDLSGRYVVRNGMLSYVISHPADLPEWRWYMEPSIIGDYIYYTDYRFVLIDEEATEINHVEQQEPEVPQAIYNLSGQRVVNPEKGTIYIINGKKVIY